MYNVSYKIKAVGDFQETELHSPQVFYRMLKKLHLLSAPKHLDCNMAKWILRGEIAFSKNAFIFNP